MDGLPHTKRCSKCREEKHLEHFDRSKSGTFRRCAYCKPCARRIRKEHLHKAKGQPNRGKSRVQRQQPSEKECTRCGTVKSIDQYAKRYRAKRGTYVTESVCKPCIAEYSRAWRAKNQDRVKHYNIVYRGLNRDKLLLKDRQYHAENRDSRRAYRREYYQTNKTHHQLTLKLWHLDNPSAKIEYEQRRQAIKRKSSGVLTKDEIDDIIEASDGVCSYCLKPCESLTLDHVIPLAKGGLHEASNVVAACRNCNSQKQARGPLSMLNRCDSARR